MRAIRTVKGNRKGSRPHTPRSNSPPLGAPLGLFRGGRTGCKESAAPDHWAEDWPSSG